MLAARDQENLVHGHQQVASSKPLNQGTRSVQPKTPGYRFPKTPLKVPLNDENAPAGFGGKSVLGTKGKGQENAVTVTGKKAVNNAFVTPMGPRTRAPLGMKTTNAKAKAFQTPAIPAPKNELEKPVAKQTSIRRPKRVVHADKLEVHGDESPLHDREVEYCPPKPKDLPYESDVFPDKCLNYEPLKPENLMRGLYTRYQASVDENGLTKQDHEDEENRARSAQKADEAILAMMEEDWTVGDVPETFRHLKKKSSGTTTIPKVSKQTKFTPPSSHGLNTITSRKAVSALSVPPKSAPLQPKVTKPTPKSLPFLTKEPTVPVPTNISAMRHTAATAASRNTIGYTKGRTASSILHPKESTFTTSSLYKRPGSSFQRSVSNVSTGSDSTITPAKFASQETEIGNEEWRRLNFLKAFHVEDEELEPGLRGLLPESFGDEEEEEFVMGFGR
ncbi:hypothetical protein B7494_g7137 [Chlorociboria aeruginascens]|nr:hypothetical protein B7494_g7137 [Chlorociboria aeruginascens]